MYFDDKKKKEFEILVAKKIRQTLSYARRAANVLYKIITNEINCKFCFFCLFVFPTVVVVSVTVYKAAVEY